MFDLPSPYDDGSLKYNYPEGRMYLTDTLYVPEYIYKMVETLNIALVSTIIGFALGFCLCFLAASNLVTQRWLRFFVRRFMEVLRAFPEIVIAGFFLAVLSIGPIPAILAVSIHTVGALGKMFFEVVENADMRPDEGLRAAGANWPERVWFGIVPQVMPNFLSYALLRLEINVRASTIIGAVGGGGIGEVLRLSISQTHEAKTLAIVLLLFLTIIAVDQFSAWSCAASWSASRPSPSAGETDDGGADPDGHRRHRRPAPGSLRRLKAQAGDKLADRARRRRLSRLRLVVFRGRQRARQRQLGDRRHLSGRLGFLRNAAQHRVHRRGPGNPVSALFRLQRRAASRLDHSAGCPRAGRCRPDRDDDRRRLGRGRARPSDRAARYRNTGYHHLAGRDGDRRRAAAVMGGAGRAGRFHHS